MRAMIFPIQRGLLHILDKFFDLVGNDMDLFRFLAQVRVGERDDTTSIHLNLSIREITDWAKSVYSRLAASRSTCQPTGIDSAIAVSSARFLLLRRSCQR